MSLSEPHIFNVNEALLLPITTGNNDMTRNENLYIAVVLGRMSRTGKSCKQRELHSEQRRCVILNDGHVRIREDGGKVPYSYDYTQHHFL